VHGGGAAGQLIDLGELAARCVEADLEAFGFAGPALAFGFGDAVVQVGADLLQPGALGWVWPQERAPDAGLTEMALSWDASPPRRWV
jgi:hypothetical protein